MQDITQFNQKDIEILDETLLYNGFFKMKKIRFRHKLFNGGMSGEVSRELLERGEAAAVIAYDPAADKVILVEQVRIGAYDPASEQSPWLLELIAGMVEAGETPRAVAIRESREEAGIRLSRLEPVFSIWDSPGGSRERIHLFVAQVDSGTAGGIHGLAGEHEDIKVHVLERRTAYHWLCTGKINNAVTLIGLQWLQLNYLDLQARWC
ncbi:ADP-ribose pyrophosphatase [Mesocricetibacter intestinalis]|uniref:ADP-ribose pyrophosphatase n=1 Tax=Mesocricetibacter intestinalis TaxID=1521930 RepID=A0A4R6VBJ5_9PAST|nr:ADP-ribose diphosphatase [Mesocricetibacter intestinalis]TDQ57879.1 ADP-ribose pyrophosphatase [Mesocricetibacter intestinalis]